MPWTGDAARTRAPAPGAAENEGMAHMTTKRTAREGARAVLARILVIPQGSLHGMSNFLSVATDCSVFPLRVPLLGCRGSVRSMEKRCIADDATDPPNRIDSGGRWVRTKRLSSSGTLTAIGDAVWRKMRKRRLLRGRAPGVNL